MEPSPRKIAVLLLNMGGPDSLESVPLFLRNLFMDPDIFRLPMARVTQPLFARLIAGMRAPKVRRQYARIGGRSPLAPLSHAQAVALRATLHRRGLDASVAVAMRYWHPFTEEALRELEQTASGAPLVALPLYPQYSKATTGSSLRVLMNALGQRNPFGRFSFIPHYFDRTAYIDALAERIEEGLHRLAATGADPGAMRLLFSAHGLPKSFVREGDPYVGQIEQTVALVRERFANVPAHLAYQSRVGPVEWVGPPVERMLKDLARQRVKSLLVVPVSFVSDHIETLYEIDVTYAQRARELGIERFERIRSLNASPTFINLLADLVVEESTHA